MCSACASPTIRSAPASGSIACQRARQSLRGHRDRLLAGQPTRQPPPRALGAHQRPHRSRGPSHAGRARPCSVVFRRTAAVTAVDRSHGRAPPWTRAGARTRVDADVMSEPATTETERKKPTCKCGHDRKHYMVSADPVQPVAGVHRVDGHLAEASLRRVPLPSVRSGVRPLREHLRVRPRRPLTAVFLRSRADSSHPRRHAVPRTLSRR